MLASEPDRLEAALPSREAEAARYALLRRLAPSMRHHLVVNLQPIGMIYEVMDRRLRAAQPDLGHVQESAAKINSFARAALASCIDVVGWLAPDDTASVAVDECARECASLLATSLSFRGFALRNEVGAVARKVRRSSLRVLLTGSLVHASDHLKPPMQMVLAGQEEDGGVLLKVSTRPSEGDKGFAGEPNYRPLTWGDLQALAAAEGAVVRKEGEVLTFRLPWAE
ncbi:hypothetical protein HHL11_28175 [Ramlibacter sp. G-1-2-2]|uniref:Histidine kinase n=1 Tax=Ramlibacter agri TaxID=2728837 RepID=A0A848HDV5_9BURK|nr:hypothetical protein [Ramlibacter agri]NML47659.1 hypothetical protein [Ramlibacter agri]